VLAVEVDEGTETLAGRLSEIGLRVAREDRLLLVPLESDGTYDTIMQAVADLDLPLHRLEQRRHHVAELFAQRAGDVAPALAAAAPVEAPVPTQEVARADG
jgi:ABC-2 type transport system ATP-binding protein